MPNVDGGHYFLTVLAPIRTDFAKAETEQGLDDGWSHSHSARLAQLLASFPTGRQTASSPAGAPPSPFAGNMLNHFARFVIIGGPIFNGRYSGNTLVALAGSVDPLVPQPVDRFANPYLAFIADFDAQGMAAEAALLAYTNALWASMASELRSVFGHCLAFDGVTTAEAFHDYIKRCQVETAMPFNDYWPDDELKPRPDKPGGLSGLAVVISALKLFCLVAAGWAVALIVNIVTAAFGYHGAAQDVARWITTWIGIGLFAILIIVAILLWIGYRYVLYAGRKPFKTAEVATLPTILKSLYLQREFTRFIIDTQGLGPSDLHAKFGAFVSRVKPDDASPTQAPGALEMPL